MSKASDLKARGGNSSTGSTSTTSAREQLEKFLKERAAQGGGDRELREKMAAELKDSIAEAKEAYERCILAIINLITEIDLIDENISRMEKQLKKIEKEEE